MSENTPALREAIFNKRMLICIFTGFSSGLPLFVFINLLPAWMNDAHVDIKAIGLMALLQVPYIAKFLWAPLLDHFTIGQFGRRRGWMILLHLGLIVSLILMGRMDPASQLMAISAMGLVVTFFSATLDIAIDAYRIEVAGGLIPGSLALYLSDTGLAWPTVFMVVALFMLPGLVMSLLIAEPQLKQLPPRTLDAAIILPFKEFFTRHGVLAALEGLLFIFLFKLGDSLATSLATKFYLDMGFSKTEIAIIAKNAGLWCGITGGILGGLWMIKLGINRALWLFGAAQLLVIPLFAWLSIAGHNPVVLAIVVGAEAFGVGLGTAAFVAFIAKTTNPLYTATQLALLTALAAVPRTLINAYAGFMVDGLGWTNFFWICTILGIPGMLMLVRVAPWKEPDAETTQKA